MHVTRGSVILCSRKIEEMTRINKTKMKILYLPDELYSLILSFANFKTILLVSIVNKHMHRYILKHKLLWNNLIDFHIAGFRCTFKQALNDSVDEYSPIKLYCELYKILTKRFDIQQALIESSILNGFKLDWEEFAKIIHYSPLFTKDSITSIFNLEGSPDLKHQYVSLFHTKNIQIPRILKNFLTKFTVKKLSPHALLGLLKNLSDHYWKNNAHLHEKFRESDAFLTIFYAMITVEADFCKTLSYNKMTKREFIKCCQGTYDKDVFDDDLLSSIYDFVLLEGLDLDLKTEFNPRSKIVCSTFKNCSVVDSTGNMTIGGRLEKIEIIK